MAVAVKKCLSTAEFLALPEDGSRYELEFGVLIEVTRPAYEHNKLMLWLWRLLADHIQPRQLGDVNVDTLVILDEAEGVVYAPDVLYLASEHLDRIRDGCVWGAPDLVVGILSPSTSPRDRGVKLRNYQRYQVPWYWLVAPEDQTIFEYRWTAEGYLLTATVLSGETFQPGLFPGLEIRLHDFHAIPQPADGSPGSSPASPL
jgi:Uma2 family endonuclease